MFLGLKSGIFSELEMSDPSNTFVTKLHNYQKQALYWMLMREGLVNREEYEKKFNLRGRDLHPMF